MDGDDAREKIFKAALELISEDAVMKRVTMRRIAERAGVNLALINYYFRSKENLLSLAVARRMDGIIGKVLDGGGGGADPASRLETLLVSTADFAFRYLENWRVSAATDVKLGCRNACAMVMPLLKEIYADKTETDVRITALQLMLPFYGIVLHTEAYNDMLGIDFFDPPQRAAAVRRMVGSIVRNDRNHEGGGNV